MDELRKKTRYAFFCPQEEPYLHWYISPPTDELNETDKHIIALIVKNSTLLGSTKNDDKPSEILKKCIWIISAKNDLKCCLFPENKHEPSIFPEGTVHEGIKKLGSGWIACGKVNYEPVISYLSREFHLLIYEAQDWN